MDIFSLLLLSICFFIFLFILFILANDDFVLLRKHVSIHNLFDLSFIVFVIALLSARVTYVLFHFSFGFLNPLVFFIFPYFPGLTISGGIIGATLFLFFYCIIGKLPQKRVWDIFSLAMLGCLPVGLLLFLLHEKKTFFSGIACIILIIFSFAFFVFIIRLFQKGSIRDGATAWLSLSFFSFVSLLSGFLYDKEKIFYSLSINQIMLFFLSIIFLLLFLREEYLLFKEKHL